MFTDLEEGLAELFEQTAPARLGFVKSGFQFLQGRLSRAVPRTLTCLCGGDFFWSGLGRQPTFCSPACRSRFRAPGREGALRNAFARGVRCGHGPCGVTFVIPARAHGALARKKFCSRRCYGRALYAQQCALIALRAA